MVVRVLDMFSGTKSIEKTLKKMIPTAEVISVDNQPKFKPTILADILTLDYKNLWKPGEFNAVWCSSPCTAYSLARNSVPRDFELTDKLVRRAIKIIEYLKPKLWVMENPRGFMRLRPFMKRMNKHRFTVNYCQYSGVGDVYKYPKPTDLWTNKQNFVPKMCTAAKRCNYFVHNGHTHTAQRGNSRHVDSEPSIGAITPERVYRVPRKLIAELFSDFI
jgi:site-specific DNA-cytosine methylase